MHAINTCPGRCASRQRQSVKSFERKSRWLAIYLQNANARENMSVERMCVHAYLNRPYITRVVKFCARRVTQNAQYFTSPNIIRNSIYMCNKYNLYFTIFYSQNLETISSNLHIVTNLSVILMQRRIPQEQVHENTICTCLDQRCSRSWLLGSVHCY